MAYSVAIFAFAFLIGDLLVRLGPLSSYYLPIVLFVPVAALLLVRRAAQLPRDLVQQARQVGNETPPAGVSTDANVRVIPPAHSEWRSNGMLSRLNALTAANRMSGSSRGGSNGLTVGSAPNSPPGDGREWMTASSQLVDSESESRTTPGSAGSVPVIGRDLGEPQPHPLGTRDWWKSRRNPPPTPPSRPRD